MKKIIYGALFLATVGITVLACKKEVLKKESTITKNDFTPELRTPEFNNKLNVGTTGRFLVFKSIEDYAKVVNMPDSNIRTTFNIIVKELGHQSLHNATLKSGKDENLISDKYFASILSEDLTVQIADHIFKINPKKEAVFALSSKYISEYKDLVNENENNPHVVRYSTNDDVLALVNNGSNAPIEKCSEDGAGSRGAYKSYSNPPYYIVGISITIQYHKYGIYNSITIDAQNHYSAYGTRIYIELEDIWYHQKCGYTTGPYSHPWWSDGNPKNLITYLSYQGMRPLNGYHIKARTRLEIGSTSSYTTYFTPFAVIEANSPW